MDRTKGQSRNKKERTIRNSHVCWNERGKQKGGWEATQHATHANSEFGGAQWGNIETK